ncbi:hypothetical protein AMJ74_00090 [candidate division WOR_3 bacterium SM1_77]|uniref:VWFA domain-containing protein n=1 Tax=candidate division WOR_3 bacterium SM1_77 TaxID=1703778 RepID=A0A0S8K2C7_UNCW3|nr:MAG: hypothetical protein AMJ74_00090 [candidate division WOR_3 bacterium SM1_77]
MRFAQPFYFLLLLLIVPLVYFEFRKKKGAVRFSDLSFFKTIPNRAKILRYVPIILNIAVLTLISFALARPQRGRVYEEVETKGVDIMLCLDISTSMIAPDFTPKNRLFVAKEQAKEFISKRKGDRIGLVVFAADALTQCPLTFDHKILRDLIDYVNFGILEDGTAIGVGLATAVTRLKDSKAKEKMIILLTDGVNNTGELDPTSSAKLCQTYHIKVYCIGVGKKEPFIFFANHPAVGRGRMRAEPIDMNTLNEISALTEGKAFLATDAEALKIIYEEIDRMEPTKFKVSQHTVYSEKASAFMLPALIVLITNFLLGFTFLRKLP